MSYSDYESFYFTSDFDFTKTKSNSGENKHYLHLIYQVYFASKKQILPTKINIIKNLFNFINDEKTGKEKLLTCISYELYTECIYKYAPDANKNIYIYTVQLKDKLNMSLGHPLKFIDLKLMSKFLEELNKYILNTQNSSIVDEVTIPKVTQKKKKKKIVLNLGKKNKKTDTPVKSPPKTSIKTPVKTPKKLTYNDLPELSDSDYLEMLNKVENTDLVLPKPPEPELLSDVSNKQVAEQILEKVLMSKYDNSKFPSNTAKLISFG